MAQPLLTQEVYIERKVGKDVSKKLKLVKTIK